MSAPAVLEELKSSAYPSLERKPGKQNWVDYAGGLPSYIERIAKHIHYEGGHPVGTAIAMAVNTCRRWCKGGTVSKSSGPEKSSGTSGQTKAKACAAIAEWEAKKKSGSAAMKARKVSESLTREERDAMLTLLREGEMQRYADLALLEEMDDGDRERRFELLASYDEVLTRGAREQTVALALAATRGEPVERQILSIGGVPARGVVVAEARREVRRAIADLGRLDALAEVAYKCPECGHAMPKGKAKACPHCGHALQEAPAKRGRGGTAPVHPSAPPQPSEEGTGPLAKGAKGERVRHLQNRLNATGESLVVDGQFGDHTEAAVHAAQERGGEKADGVVGGRTTELLRQMPAAENIPEGADDQRGGPSGAAPAGAAGSAAGGVGGPKGEAGGAAGRTRAVAETLHKGHGVGEKRGHPGVRKVQARLGVLGHPTKADGSFGPETEKRVRAFQRKQGLKADGIVGPKTHRTLQKAGKAHVKKLFEAGLAAEEALLGPGRDAVRAARNVRAIKRLPDGSFAPAGTGTALSGTPAAPFHVTNTHGGATQALGVMSPQQIRTVSNADELHRIADAHPDGEFAHHLRRAARINPGERSMMGDTFQHRGDRDLALGAVRRLKAHYLHEGLEEATLGRGGAAKALTELKRLPNGEFAPKGSGTILYPGQKVHVPHKEAGKPPVVGRVLPAKQNIQGIFRSDVYLREGPDKGSTVKIAQGMVDNTPGAQAAAEKQAASAESGTPKWQAYKSKDGTWSVSNGKGVRTAHPDKASAEAAAAAKNNPGKLKGVAKIEAGAGSDSNAALDSAIKMTHGSSLGTAKLPHIDAVQAGTATPEQHDKLIAHLNSEATGHAYSDSPGAAKTYSDAAAHVESLKAKLKPKSAPTTGPHPMADEPSIAAGKPKAAVKSDAAPVAGDEKVHKAWKAFDSKKSAHDALEPGHPDKSKAAAQMRAAKFRIKKAGGDPAKRPNAVPDPAGPVTVQKGKPPGEHAIPPDPKAGKGAPPLNVVNIKDLVVGGALSGPEGTVERLNTGGYKVTLKATGKSIEVTTPRKAMQHLASAGALASPPGAHPESGKTKPAPTTGAHPLQDEPSIAAAKPKPGAAKAAGPKGLEAKTAQAQKDFDKTASGTEYDALPKWDFTPQEVMQLVPGVTNGNTDDAMLLTRAKPESLAAALTPEQANSVANAAEDVNYHGLASTLRDAAAAKGDSGAAAAQATTKAAKAGASVDDALKAGDAAKAAADAKSHPAQKALDAYKSAGGDDPAVLAALQSAVPQAKPSAPAAAPAPAPAPAAPPAPQGAPPFAKGDQVTINSPHAIHTEVNGKTGSVEKVVTSHTAAGQAHAVHVDVGGQKAVVKPNLLTKAAAPAPAAEPAAPAAPGPPAAAPAAPGDAAAAQGKQLADLPLGTKFSLKSGEQYTLHKEAGNGFMIAKPVGGGKAKPFHGKMAPAQVHELGTGDTGAQAAAPQPGEQGSARADALKASIDAQKGAAAPAPAPAASPPATPAAPAGKPDVKSMSTADLEAEWGEIHNSKLEVRKKQVYNELAGRNEAGPGHVRPAAAGPQADPQSQAPDAKFAVGKKLKAPNGQTWTVTGHNGGKVFAKQDGGAKNEQAAPIDQSIPWEEVAAEPAKPRSSGVGSAGPAKAAGKGIHPMLKAEGSDVTAQQFGSVAGKTIVVTGVIPGHTRKSIESLVGEHGGKKGKVDAGQTPDLLIAGEKAGSKLTKAKAAGIPVMTWDEAKKLFEAADGPFTVVQTTGQYVDELLESLAAAAG